jgi:hypothetical protein
VKRPHVLQEIIILQCYRYSERREDEWKKKWMNRMQDETEFLKRDEG